MAGALKGGPRLQFSEAISRVVDCADQSEVDELWAKKAAPRAVADG
jgi:predicted 3-demethylubiquinone-9 3-methyltransferase (glyoxalase superfamily)